MPATKENAPSRGTSSAEGNDQNPLKGTIEMNATSVPNTTDIALASIERARRPHWAPEGTWSYDSIYYARTMTHGTVKIDVFLNRTPLDWTFGPTEINVLEDEGIDVDTARLVAADLAEAIATLEGAQ